MQTNADFAEFFKSLNSHKVRYVVVGGYAVIFHTKPRATEDLDILIEATPENAQRLMKALAEFGFGGIGLKESDFTTSKQTVQLGYPPNRIDINTSITNVEFGDAFPRRSESTYGDVPVAYLSVADLLKNKEAVGRPKDLLDVELLKTSFRK